MNNYRSPAPRVAFGFAAVVMTALSFGVLVILPSRLESDSHARVLWDIIAAKMKLA